MAEDRHARPDARPFFARVIGGSPGSPPVIALGIELAPGQPGGRCPAMQLRIPIRQAVRMHAQLGRAIERARRDGYAEEGGPAEA